MVKVIYRRFPKNYLILLLLVIWANSLSAQIQDTSQYKLNWTRLTDGIWICEPSLPEKSIAGDSKCTIVKIDPQLNDFKLLTASEHGKFNRTAMEWGNEFGVSIAFNAGMYFLSNQSVSRGYMQNYNHINNSKLNLSYNIVLAFNPKNSKDPSFKIFDLSCDSFDSFSNKYNSFSQVMRMVDCSGKGLSWDKRAGQKCSMIFIASDVSDNIYILFVRSPYTHNYMINYLLSLPIKAKIAGYLEGGPETSLYVKTDSIMLKKWGSYVSKTYENDNNDHFWKIPNVIGVIPKKPKSTNSN